MKPVKQSEVRAYIHGNIGGFHTSRLSSLKDLRLNDVLKKKNPYLFKAKNILVASDLVETLLDAHLSSQEETIFGHFLEGLAIFINGLAYGGKKSAAEGIDLEFETDGKRYIVSIKSGPNWGNSSQIKRMVDNFAKAKRILRPTNSDPEVIAVNGCCYGRDSKPHKKYDYFKYCGQRFWHFISGDPDLYLGIIVPMGLRAKEKNDEFAEERARIVNIFTEEFSHRFAIDGRIDWDALVKFNSSASKP